MSEPVDPVNHPPHYKQGGIECIVAIEYGNRRPFNVLTEHHWDHSREPWFKPGEDKPNGACAAHWDFEWSRTDRESYYHMSGCGGSVQLFVARYAKPSPPPGELWIADGVQILRYGRQCKEQVVKGDEELLKMGYRRLRRPRLLTSVYGEKTRNPFEAASEGECIYCDFCKDWRCKDDSTPCEHIDWCDQCGMWFYVDGRKLVGEVGVCDCREDEEL